MDSKYLIQIETSNPGNLKATFALLKEQITEANIDITPEYIEILQMDPTHNVVAHVRLYATNFNKYICKKSIKIGVDVTNLTKILKGVGTKDFLTIFVEDPSTMPHHVEDSGATHPFGFLIENPEKGQISKVYLDTLDVNEDEMGVPDLDYPYQIYMPSTDLQTIVNNMKNIGGDILKISYTKDTLSFYTKGEIGQSETTRSRTNKEDVSIKVKKNGEEDSCEIINIYVKLQKLVEFTKCSTLSQIATLFLKNDHPLFLEYDVGDLGFIRLGLSPHIKPETF